MTRLRIQRVTSVSAAGESQRAERIAKRAVELLGQQLAMGDAIAPRRKLTLDIQMQLGETDELAARRIAKQLATTLR